jgi:hypothetical protein
VNTKSDMWQGTLAVMKLEWEQAPAMLGRLFSPMSRWP